MLNIFFYLFSSMIILSSLGVIISSNPVYALLWLIFSFCSTAGLFVLFGAEYLSMILIIVYVGAVAVLFLFVIMMLDIDVAEMKKQLRKHMFIGTSVSLAFLVNVSLIVSSAFAVKNAQQTEKTLPKNEGIAHESNLDYQNIGEYIYTDHVIAFQIAGGVLLAAMLGCIVLTLTSSSHKRQNSISQVYRTKEECMTIVKVQRGIGIE